MQGSDTAFSSIPRSTTKASYDTVSVGYSSFKFKGLACVPSNCTAGKLPCFLSYPLYWVRFSVLNLEGSHTSGRTPRSAVLFQGIFLFQSTSRPYLADKEHRFLLARIVYLKSAVLSEKVSRAPYSKGHIRPFRQCLCRKFLKGGPRLIRK